MRISASSLGITIPPIIFRSSLLSMIPVEPLSDRSPSPLTSALRFAGWHSGPTTCFTPLWCGALALPFSPWNSSGAVQQTYPGSVYVAGNLSYGKIALDSQYIYVAAQDLLTRFTLGQPNSGTAI